MSTVEARAFRDTLGRYPTGVSIITTTDGDGVWSGATIGSFTSLSLSPPLVLFCLDKSALCHPAFMQAKVYCVNVLAEDQTDLSNIFASR
ncbi:MAG: flavin reductase family protein, partial [Alphaproteobacteria bacterium]